MISLEGVNKKFVLEGRKNVGALTRLSAFSKRDRKKTITALKDISFFADYGETVGVIGRNGSGKSTLLKAIARIYRADSGRIFTSSLPLYLSGFSRGLINRLSMRENIFLIGSLFGLSDKETKEVFSELVDFSGLADFVDVEVSKFSSGMVSRLSFSATVFCAMRRNPKIILLDEAFEGGGDEEFKKKSLAKMEEFVAGKKTIVLASHDLEIIKKYCQKVFWMEGGGVKKAGKADEITAEYEDSFGFTQSPPSFNRRPVGGVLNHRMAVGGLWEEIGELQMSFLIKNGLKPEHRFLDIGCGALRLGAKLVPYLDRGNYCGIDINGDLIKAGIDKELARGSLKEKAPNFVVSGQFEFDYFPHKFDYIMAQSLFPHLSLDGIIACLLNAKKKLSDNGVIYATFYEADSEDDLVRKNGPGKQYADFYSLAADFLGLDFRYMGDWGHPRGQKMLAFIKKQPLWK